MVNRQIDSAMNRQGHGDMFMVSDAGFACPDHVEVIDIALSKGKPTILEVLAELRKIQSVEKIILAQDTAEHNPTYLRDVSESFGEGVAVEVISHAKLKEFSNSVKTIIRTGDYTAWGNVILISGAGDGWQMEQ